MNYELYTKNSLLPPMNRQGISKFPSFSPFPSFVKHPLEFDERHFENSDDLMISELGSNFFLYISYCTHEF